MLDIDEVGMIAEQVAKLPGSPGLAGLRDGLRHNTRRLACDSIAAGTMFVCSSYCIQAPLIPSYLSAKLIQVPLPLRPVLDIAIKRRESGRTVAYFKECPSMKSNNCATYDVLHVKCLSAPKGL